MAGSQARYVMTACSLDDTLGPAMQELEAGGVPTTVAQEGLRLFITIPGRPPPPPTTIAREQPPLLIKIPPRPRPPPAPISPDLGSQPRTDGSEKSKGGGANGGKRYKYPWMSGGRLNIPQVEWSSPANSVAAAPVATAAQNQPANPIQSDAVACGAAETTKLKKRVHRPRSHAKRDQPRGGLKRKLDSDDDRSSSDRSLHAHHRKKGKTFQTPGLSVQRDGSRTTTGWYGGRPPKDAHKLISEMYDAGTIGQAISDFALIHNDPASKSPTFLLDCEGRLFLVRTSPFSWLKDRGEEFYKAVLDLLASELRRPDFDPQLSSGLRGRHIACLMGHHRQYTSYTTLESWHEKNLDACNAFINSPIVQDIISLSTSLLKLFFPGIAERYKRCAEWQQRRYGISPLFGLFFQFCINGIPFGEDRVHCRPHVDSKNVIGVCLILVYDTPGHSFDHQRKSWLVIWEAGVIIELPPWVVLIYPSSMFLHFNIDLSDLKIVTTANGETPTPSNSQEVGNGLSGRGSVVLFNQASLFQSSETGYDTLQHAQAAGQSTSIDFNETINQSMERIGVRIPLA